MSEVLPETILLIEDGQADAGLFYETLREQSADSTTLVHLGLMSDAETYLARNTVDIILLDVRLPDVQGLEAVRRAHAAAPETTLVVLTDQDDESLAARAMQEGAQDCLFKVKIERRNLARALRIARERKSMEDALLTERGHAQITLNSIADAVVCTDISGNISFLNLVAETITGWSLEEARGRPTAEVLQILDGASGKPVPDPMERAVQQDKASFLPSNSILVQRDGGEVPIEDSVAPIHDGHGKPTGAVIVFHDVSAARAREAEAAHVAAHDFLTGLPNRMLLLDRINQSIAATPRHLKGIAVLFIDLDGFKHINDSLGHSIGDRLLQSISKRLVSCVRGSDTVSRQGGDEFVVLLAEVNNPRDVSVMARRMLKTVAHPHSLNLHDVHVTASIGVSVYPGDGADAETLIKNADTAMYQAKDAGRRGYKFFKAAMNVRAAERQSIEVSLRRAMELNEFHLHYQPIIDLRTGQITGAEALLRWTHPVRGSVPRAQFIPVAEDCGLIIPIGNWVLHEACRQARSWQDAGLPHLGMAVNISAVEFRGGKLLERVFSALDDTGLDPRYLDVEMAESVLMKHPESTASILKQLRAKGVRVSIDDFGTGYSSLSQLWKFPIDSLKIDQSFIRQIATSPDDASLVIAMISMGQSLKLRVIAEGVETQDELSFLQEHHCDEAQGYYLSRPMLPAEFARLLGDGPLQGSFPGHGGDPDADRWKRHPAA